jgi:hypothetical protein
MCLCVRVYLCVLVYACVCMCVYVRVSGAACSLGTEQNCIVFGQRRRGQLDQSECKDGCECRKAGLALTRDYGGSLREKNAIFFRSGFVKRVFVSGSHLHYKIVLLG